MLHTHRHNTHRVSRLTSKPSVPFCRQLFLAEKSFCIGRKNIHSKAGTMPKLKPKSNVYWPLASHTTPTHTHPRTHLQTLSSSVYSLKFWSRRCVLSSCRCDSWPLPEFHFVVFCSLFNMRLVFLWHPWPVNRIGQYFPLTKQPGNSWLMPHEKVEMTHKKTLNANLHLQCHRCIFKLLSLKWTAGHGGQGDRQAGVTGASALKASVPESSQSGDSIAKGVHKYLQHF